MRGALLPVALLWAVLAMALASAPRRVRLAGIAATIAVAAVIAPLSLPPAWTDRAFAACWLALLLVATTVYLQPRRAWAVYLPAAVMAGACAGLVAALAGAPTDLPRAAPVLALVLPGAWLVARGWSIALKVATSWAVAIALLAAVLPSAPGTPGYVADHME